VRGLSTARPSEVRGRTLDLSAKDVRQPSALVWTAKPGSCNCELVAKEAPFGVVQVRNPSRSVLVVAVTSHAAGRADDLRMGGACPGTVYRRVRLASLIAVVVKEAVSTQEWKILTADAWALRDATPFLASRQGSEPAESHDGVAWTSAAPYDVRGMPRHVSDLPGLHQSGRVARAVFHESAIRSRMGGVTATMVGTTRCRVANAPTPAFRADLAEVT
jgi:hypothetical protein